MRGKRNPRQELRCREARLACAGAVPLAHVPVEPGLGIGPVPVRRAQGDAQGRRGLLGREPREVAELDDLRSRRLLGGQPLEHVVECEKVVGAPLRFDVQVLQIDAGPPAAVPDAALPPGPLDEEAAHRLGRGAEEVAAAVPVGVGLAAYQPQVGLVDQGGRLQGLAGFLPGQFLGGQFA